jgi:inhibitor of cysteine peptidase
MPRHHRFPATAIIALSLVLAACTPSGTDAASKEAAPAQPVQESDATPSAPDEFASAAIFECEGGGELAVLFEYGEPPTARVRAGGGAAQTLKMSDNAGEPVYTDGSTSFSLQGGDALYGSGTGAKTPCRGVSRPIPPPRVDGVVRDVQAADAGAEVVLTVGQRLSVSLSGVPTAGYLWAPQGTPVFLEKVAETGGPTTTAQFLPGFAGGNHWEVTVFEAKAVGEGELVMVQRRPWEDTAEPDAATFKVKVKVQ